MLGNINCSGNSVVNSGLTVLGNINCSGTGIFPNLQASNFSFSSISDASGINSLENIVYQNNQLKTIDVANSGSFISPQQLTVFDAEYQFLYPTGTSIVYLPNGTGLYMGKKFTLVNMNSSANTIYVRKSGDGSDLATISAQYNISIVHAGNNNWVRLSYNSGGVSNVVN